MKEFEKVHSGVGRFQSWERMRKREGVRGEGGGGRGEEGEKGAEGMGDPLRVKLKTGGP